MSDDLIRETLPKVLQGTDFNLGKRVAGKVRDSYLLGDTRVLITSDRLSAFDRIITCVPFKGQVLSQLAAWWFEQTADVVQNHVINLPDPNVTVVHEAQTLPVEVVVRGYITGVTSTALWTLYNDGVDRPYGLTLPKGLVKNQRLETPVITPTTKAGPGEHDERLSSAEVVSRGLVEPKLWAEVQATALKLFARGTEIAAKNGMILVDTKYEFGMVDGVLTVIDEVHTPDSSRYWYANTYDAAMAAGEQPKALDKEYLRRWLKSTGYMGDGPPPAVPEAVIIETAKRYIEAYERLTGLRFEPAEQPAEPRIRKALGV